MNLRKLFILYLRKNVKIIRKVHSNVKKFPRVYQCSNCTKKFGDLGNFFEHRNSCKTTSRGQIPCPICGKIVKTKSIQQHLKLHSNERDYLCPECGSSFSQKPGLWVHIKQAHQQTTVHKCRYCGHICRNQPQLWNHEWSHKNPQGIACDLCNKVFKAPNLLNNHKSNVHRKSPKVEVVKEDFSCQDCDHRFKSKQQLIRHRVKHSKEKPFVCPLCDQSFGWKRSLNAHVKQFHTAFLYTTIDYMSDTDFLIN